MADPVDRWKGRRVRRWLFAIWSTASLAMCAREQYASISFFDRIPYAFAWVIAFVALVSVTTLVAGIRSSWREAGRSFAEAVVLLLATAAAMLGLDRTFKGLGLGHWPPRDGVYARRFHERRSEWLAEHDRLLHDKKAAATIPTQKSEPHRRPGPFDFHYVDLGRIREWGAEYVAVADDGSWIKFIFYEGEHDRTPIQEKGLLYVDPEVLAHADARWVDVLAVEDLGDGWYVYEE